MNQDKMLAEVHAMLSAQAKATGMITFIDAYTLFQNSEAGPYVGLYNTRRNHREGRVYVKGFDGNGNSAEFRKLPKALQDAVIQSLAEEQPPEAPRSEGREYIEQRSLLRQCQPFKVVRYKYASADENDKEPWRIERCFEVGNVNRQAPRQHEQRPAAPSQEPTTKSVDPNRDGIVAELWNLVPTVYKNWKQEAERLIDGVTVGRASQLKELDADELARFRAIVLLDKLGMATYGADWIAIRDGMIADAGYDSVCLVSLDNLRNLYKQVKAMAENAVVESA